MAHYLNYPFTTPLQPVAHDVAPLCRSVDAFLRAYKEEGMWGAVEIAGAMAWRIIREEIPEMKTVVVRRPLQEVYNSIVGKGFLAHLSNLAELNAMLDVIGAQPGVYTINASDLDTPVACKWLFEYCLELEFDFDWWYKLSQMNIQINLEEAASMKEETAVRYTEFQADVLRRTEGLNTCLH